MKTVGELFPSRRELLQFGGLGLLGAAAQGVWPLQAASGGKVTPRGNARNVIYFELSGAISHVEAWDFKENKGTPKDLAVSRAGNLHLSQLLFPKFSKQIGKFAVVRSLKSHEEVHFRGQYYVQTGRQLNLSFAKEIPSIGSVIAQELESRRRERDTFPTYLSFYLEKGAAGALSTGFLPPRYSVVDINPESAVKGAALDEKAVELLEERWRLLTQLRDAGGKRAAKLARSMEGYGDFYENAHRLLSDSRWPAAFQISDADRARYGNTPVGISSILARNVLQQDAGTHYIHICHPGWDHHVQIWDRSAPSNHYKLCEELDPALSSLMEDLDTSGRLKDTLVVVMGEFGRTPGALNNMAGRDHHNKVFPGLFAGAGVVPGKIIGASDSEGEACVETGWHRKEQPRIENVVSTIYSALGIDWTKEIRNTPSGRTYTYVDPLGANGYIPTDEISSLYA